MQKFISEILDLSGDSLINQSKKAMIDYVKIAINSIPFSLSLINNPLLSPNWRYIINPRTGSTLRFSSYKGLSFKCYPLGRVIIAGSLHKYKNGGTHNYDDFSYYKLIEVLTRLKIEFGDEILSGKIENLELGLNLTLPWKPKEFIERVIIYLKMGPKEKHPITVDDEKGFQKGVKFILSQYQIKIYDKGLQYNQPENILRIEFKTQKMNIIKDANLKTVINLTDLEKLQYVFFKLLDSLRHILIRETVDMTCLSEHERKVLLECENPSFWHRLSKQKRNQRKKRYKDILNNHSMTDFSSSIKSLLQSKFSEMTIKNEECKLLLSTLLNP